MDEDLFELEYADELDALDEVEPDSNPTPKSRRSLQFATPSSKNKQNRPATQDDLDSSSLSLQSLSQKNTLNNTILSESEDEGTDCGSSSQADSREASNQQQKKKRSARETELLDSAANDFFDSLPDLEVPQSKRARSSQPDKASNKENATTDSAQHTYGRNHVRRRNNEPESFDDYQLRLLEGYDLERRRVLWTIPAGDFISATSFEGRRVYMKVREKQELEHEIDSVGDRVRQSSLLTIPITVMKEQVEDERRREVLQEAEELSARVRRELANDGTGIDEEMDVEEQIYRPSSLWVEKYAPCCYTDLLSEEAVNRTLLHWLKQWDYVVFGKGLPVHKHKKKGKEPTNNKWKKFQPEVSLELDSYNRPVQKVVLLCGPPGLGKTTLAHVIATHAGYNVVEMNASDDRSVDVFRNKIEAATQMKAVMGADPRPNCLVIDEIDGAPQAAVNVLLNILKRPEGGGKKKKEGDMLLRPIICICNDQYTPALRQLRQQALVMTFPPTEPSRLASRLSEVIRREQLKADMNTLLALCERTDNDIRSCLNTLQFIRQRQAELTLQTVQTMSVGQKDAHRSLFSVWREIFTMPRPKRNRFVSIYDLMEGKADSFHLNSASPTARFQHILSLVQATGEYERVIQGLFENYLQAKSKDPHLIGLNLASEWLCFVDKLNQYTSHTQDYSVMKYVPFLPITFHLLYAAYVPPQISFPHVQFEVQQAHMKITNLLISLLVDMTPAVRKFVDIRNLTIDLLPPLLDILQPTLRPVNTQLYSSREKEDLAHLVHIMINYNITYRQERLEGQYTYVLDPNVEEVVRFSGAKQRKQLTYGAKQMIAREIDLEKMRRNEDAHVSASQKSSVVVPNHKQTLEAKPVAEDKPRVNYFAGFTRTKREKQNVQKEDQKEKEKDEKNVLDTDIWFHFKEGYSNAVRRNVRIQDLL